MKLETFIPREVSQSQKDKLHDSTVFFLKELGKFIETENRIEVTGCQA